MFCCLILAKKTMYLSCSVVAKLYSRFGLCRYSFCMVFILLKMPLVLDYYNALLLITCPILLIVKAYPSRP